jgi:hypothetical protein
MAREPGGTPSANAIIGVSPVLGLFVAHSPTNTFVPLGCGRLEMRLRQRRRDRHVKWSSSRSGFRLWTKFRSASSSSK